MSASNGLDLQDAGVVVTGAGGGIGSAMARRFAAAGARLLLADLDGDAAARIAAETGGIAIAVDAASRVGVRRLIEAATAELGGVDLYCANAGVAPEGGPEAAQDAWAQAWDVNVMAHVRAAELLLPDWLERGRGRFLATVSAAGLLTTLGSAPYAVSKHGALAFAEWLSVTYRHRGITVQALCPQGVRTRMLIEAGPTMRALVAPTAVSAETVAETVVAALADDRFLVLPHPELADHFRARANDTDRWIAGMNLMQRKIERTQTGGSDSWTDR